MSLVIFLVLASGSARAAVSTEERLVQIISRCLKNPWTDLARANLTTEVAPGVRALEVGVPLAAHEVGTAARFARESGLHVLLVPDFPFVGSVPVVDAIAFDHADRPVANLSFKTLRPFNEHPPRAAYDRIRRFRESFKRNYRGNCAHRKLYGATFLSPAHQRAAGTLNALLGLSWTTLRRPWLVLDFDRQDGLRFVVDRTAAGDRVIRYFDGAGREFATRTQVSYLARATHDVWLLLPGATLKVCEGELDIALFP